MKRKRYFFAIGLFAFCALFRPNCALLFAAETEFENGLFENNTSMDVSAPSAAVTDAAPEKSRQEIEFNETVAYFERTFAPDFKAHGAELKIAKAFIIDYPTGKAGKLGTNFWIISVTGGFITRPYGCTEVLAFALCHEIGHHLAGPPYFLHQKGYEWASAEGQADYYAATDCIKRYLRDQSNFGSKDYSDSDPEITRLCYEEFGGDDTQMKLCQGAAQVAREFMKVVMSAQSKDIHSIQTTSPSDEIVSETITSFLSDQCRMENLMAGALNKTRPPCWFQDAD